MSVDQNANVGSDIESENEGDDVHSGRDDTSAGTHDGPSARTRSAKKCENNENGEWRKLSV